MSNYSPEQLQGLAEGVNGVLGGVMQAGGSGLFGMLREGMAAMGFLKEMQERFADNELIQQVLGLVLERGTQPAEALPESADYLGQIQGALGNLQGDALGEQFKHMLYEFAERVAGAAGQGIFGTGAKVNQGEADFLVQLKQMLGL
jgi:hypothetical protein